MLKELKEHMEKELNAIRKTAYEQVKDRRSVQFSSVAQLCPTLCDPESQHARPPCPSPSPRVHSDSCPSSQWCHPAISSSVVPFSFCPQSSQHQSSNDSTLRMKWPKYWSFSFSIIPSKEIPGLISFRMDWLDLLAVQGTHFSRFKISFTKF